MIDLFVFGAVFDAALRLPLACYCGVRGCEACGITTLVVDGPSWERALAPDLRPEELEGKLEVVRVRVLQESLRHVLLPAAGSALGTFSSSARN